MAERDPERVRGELSGRFLVESIEPPSGKQIDRLVRSALHRSELALTERIAGRIGPDAAARLEAMLEASEGGVLALVRSPPGRVSLKTLLAEIAKLRAVRELSVPEDAFAGVAPRVVARWRAQAAAESPSHLRRHSPALRVTLLAAMVRQRELEITDTLVDLFIKTVHRIAASAERRVTKELVNAFKRVTGKENILFAIAEASLHAPNKPVRQVVFPAVIGGEQTLRDLVAEFKTTGPEYRRTVKTTLQHSYTGHYRRGLIELLEVLEFRSNNARHRPVLDAIEVVRRHAQARGKYYPDGGVFPDHGWLRGDWHELVLEPAADGCGQRIVRTVYEICAFQALRDQVRCKDIWVVGAEKWRNPDEDLPTDFESRREEYYATLRKPLDSGAFIGELRQEMHDELGALTSALPGLAWLDVADRGKRGAIKLAPLEALPEPRNLGRLKAAVSQRWGTVALVDMLKEAILRTGCLDAIVADGRRGELRREDLAERLILAIYAYGTNTGIRSVARDPGRERDIRYVRSRYLTPDVARFIATEIANATFIARKQSVWGAGTTSVASDSTHFGSYDQNIFTEWHSRYGGRGVLIYWHVEKKSMAIHSQLISCSASEVAAMVDGAIRHGTTMDVQANYTDTHGQSEIGFGITRLLGFDLLPRIKRINHVRLYLPEAGTGDTYAPLRPALTRPIRWDLIDDQYDQMIRYATAIRSGTASTEAILRRFLRVNAQHPTYQAMVEVGRAQRTIFLARYLRSRELQREINDGLNVMESWNSANAIIFYGKRGDLASNRQVRRASRSILPSMTGSTTARRELKSIAQAVSPLAVRSWKPSRKQSDGSTSRNALGVTTVFALAALAMPSASQAQPARSCDARGGKTLAANTEGRVYQEVSRRGVRRIVVCEYRSRETTTISEVRRRRSVTFAGVTGKWAFVVVESSPASRAGDRTTRYSSVVVTDVSRPGWVRGGRVEGYVWTAAVGSPNGRVAGSLTGEGRAIPDGQGVTTNNNSAVVVFDSNGVPSSPGYPKPTPKIIVTAPLGGISDFGGTPNTIVWRTESGVQTAPFAEPVAT